MRMGSLRNGPKLGAAPGADPQQHQGAATSPPAPSVRSLTPGEPPSPPGRTGGRRHEWNRTGNPFKFNENGGGETTPTGANKLTQGPPPPARHHQFKIMPPLDPA